MSRNRKRNREPIQVSRMVIGISAATIMVSLGLSFVYIKNQMVALGSEKKEKEDELIRLVAQRDTLEAQIAMLNSRASLQDRLRDGFIDLQPISEESLVRLDERYQFPAGPVDSLVPVALESRR